MVKGREEESCRGLSAAPHGGRACGGTADGGAGRCGGGLPQRSAQRIRWGDGDNKAVSGVAGRVG